MKGRNGEVATGRSVEKSMMMSFRADQFDLSLISLNAPLEMSPFSVQRVMTTLLCGFLSVSPLFLSVLCGAGHAF